MTTWWRAYNSSIHNKKLLKLSDAMHRAWYTLQCIASDNEGVLPPADDIAVTLRISETKVAEWIARLVQAELLDNNGGVFTPHNWETRQYKHDAKDPTGAKRAKDYRDRKRHERDASRRDDRDVTGVTTVRDERPEQSRAETEAEQSRLRAAADEPKGVQADIVERVLKTDLMDAFGPGKCPDLSRASLWLEKGYAPSMVVDVVREVLARKPDVASLAYFDAVIAERHASRAELPTERAAAAKSLSIDDAVKSFARTGKWSRYAGPEPGQTGCKASAELLAAHGIDPYGSKIRKAG